MINKKSVNIFIEKIIPSFSKKVKTAAKELKQNTNISQVYANKSNISLENINANYYIQEEVAPFAKRLLNPDRFNMVSGTTKTLKAIETTRKEISQIKDLKTRDIFEFLYSRIINETSNIENLSSGIRELVQKVEMIDNPETKEIILPEILSLACKNKKGFKNHFHNKMEFIENITDVVNIMNEKYVNIQSEPRDFYQWLKKNNSWFLDAVEGKKGTPDNYRNGCAQIKKQTLDYDTYLKNIRGTKDMQLPETYKNNLKLESFRCFVDVYNDLTPETVKKIYQNEYLKTLPQDVAEKFKEINEKYGTIVITSNPNTNLKDAEYIKEELRLWKKAGGNKAILPQVIDVDKLNKKLHQQNATGLANKYYEKVMLIDLLETDTDILHPSSTLRHEINHLNDKNLRPKNSIEELHDYIKWHLNKFLHRKEWIHELKNAGITKDLDCDYAMTDMYELKSVTAESDLQKLSDKYKKQLIKKFGMENWIFNLDKNMVRLNARVDKFKDQINKLINR